jgi:hypothetical protein
VFFMFAAGYPIVRIRGRRALAKLEEVQAGQ